MDSTKENLLVQHIKEIIELKEVPVLITKNNNLNTEIVQYGLEYKNKSLISSSEKTKDYILFLVQKLEQIIVFDLKYFVKPFLLEKEHQKIIFENYNKFCDLKSIYSNHFTKNIEITDKELYKITGINCSENDSIVFQLKNTRLENRPYQILNPKDLFFQIEKELLVCRSLYNYFSETLENSLYLDNQLKTSIIYGLIETQDISVDKTQPNIISKYFSDYFQNTESAKVLYHQNVSKTSRVHCKFNNIQKDVRDVVFSKKGYIVSCDWVCFENKALFDFLKIEWKDEDFYQTIAEELGLDRDDVKNNFIRFIYGLIDNNPVSEYCINRFDLLDKLNLFIESMKNNKDQTLFGKRFVFDSNQDIQKKVVNYYMQSYSAFILHHVVFELLKDLLKYDCNPIAILYDEIVFDVSKQDFLSVYNTIKKHLNFETDYVKFVSSIYIGKNFKEMIYVNK